MIPQLRELRLRLGEITGWVVSQSRKRCVGWSRTFTSRQSHTMYRSRNLPTSVIGKWDCRGGERFGSRSSSRPQRKLVSLSSLPLSLSRWTFAYIMFYANMVPRGERRRTDGRGSTGYGKGRGRGCSCCTAALRCPYPYSMNESC